MDAALLRRRTAAPAAWLAARQTPDLGERARLVETCRAELTWARADGLSIAVDDDGWQDALLPHEQAAARLIELWGHLHPVEHRLREGLRRARARRRADWPWLATLQDVQRYRRARRALLSAFLAAAADYRQKRMPPAAGCRTLRPAA